MTDPLDFSILHDQLGLTRVELARAMGVHYQTLIKWQRGEQKPPAVANSMARVLFLLKQRALLSRWIRKQTERLQCSSSKTVGKPSPIPPTGTASTPNADSST